MGAFLQFAKSPSILKNERLVSLMDKANTSGLPNYWHKVRARSRVTQGLGPLRGEPVIDYLTYFVGCVCLAR